jgi:hypothetical protein
VAESKDCGSAPAPASAPIIADTPTPIITEGKDPAPITPDERAEVMEEVTAGGTADVTAVKGNGHEGVECSPNTEPPTAREEAPAEAG